MVVFPLSKYTLASVERVLVLKPIGKMNKIYLKAEDIAATDSWFSSLDTVYQSLPENAPAYIPIRSPDNLTLAVPRRIFELALEDIQDIYLENNIPIVVTQATKFLEDYCKNFLIKIWGEQKI
jgi:hypothetical protein